MELFDIPELDTVRSGGKIFLKEIDGMAATTWKLCGMGSGGFHDKNVYALQDTLFVQSLKKYVAF